MSALRRLSSDGFTVEEALPLEALTTREQVQRALKPMDTALKHLPAITLTAPEAAKFKNGQAIRSEQTTETPDTPLRVYHETELIGIAHLKEANLHPQKVLS
jgi:tRNA U55 pseudouridine synthase TruB